MSKDNKIFQKILEDIGRYWKILEDIGREDIGRYWKILEDIRRWWMIAGKTG